MLSTSTAVVLFGVILVGGYLLYQAALPKPIEGLPYNKHAAKRILGDTPEAMKYVKETQEFASFLSVNAENFGQPIFQLFLRPFGRPWVIVTDFRETQDVIARRTRDFDRSDFFGDVFVGLLPGSMVHMKTGDTWKAQRRLVGDTMNPTFLNNVAAPQIYTAAEALVQLWKEKGSRLARGHPFDVKKDIYRGALDAIWAATFGTTIGTTNNQLELLSSTTDIPLTADKDAEVGFPAAKNPEAFESIITLGDSCEISLTSPFPRIHHKLALKFMPKYVKARQHKDRLIDEQLHKALAKFSKQDASEDDVKCALDITIHREIQRAKKEGRPADWDSMYVRDELFAFLIAGHETTSTTISWGLKNLTDNPNVQKKMRAVLQAEFKDANEKGHLPSAHDIVKARMPYIDAVLEEISRLSGTAPAVQRTATSDVEVLGHIIPKGTDIFFMTQGPSFTLPPIHIDESKRTQSSRESKNKSGEWNPATMGYFDPERWLTTKANGEVEFDSRAGPGLPFGGGPRGCFGRKLAEMELKILLCTIVWSFHLQPTPPALSTYKGKDAITHSPQQCYLRLSPVSS